MEYPKIEVVDYRPPRDGERGLDEDGEIARFHGNEWTEPVYILNITMPEPYVPIKYELIGPVLKSKECVARTMYECVCEGGPFRLGERRKMGAIALWVNTGNIVGGEALRWQRLEQVEDEEEPAVDCKWCGGEGFVRSSIDIAQPECPCVKERGLEEEPAVSRLEKIKRSVKAVCAQTHEHYIEEIWDMLDEEIATQAKVAETLTEILRLAKGGWDNTALDSIPHGWFREIARLAENSRNPVDAEAPQP